MTTPTTTATTTAAIRKARTVNDPTAALLASLDLLARASESGPPLPRDRCVDVLLDLYRSTDDATARSAIALAIGELDGPKIGPLTLRTITALVVAALAADSAAADVGPAHTGRSGWWRPARRSRS